MGIAADNSTVSITIRVVDANSGEVISNIEREFADLETAGAAAGQTLSSTSQGVAGMAGAIAQMGTAGAGAGVALSSTAERAAALGTSVALVGERTATADAQMQQMQQMMLRNQQAMAAMTLSATQAAAAFAAMAAEAEASGARVSTGMSRATGGMREVSGIGSEMGLRVGYSLRQMIGQSELFMTALRTIGTLFAAIGVIEIGQQIFQGAEKLYNDWLNVNSAVEQYEASVRQTQEQDVVNVRSIEDADARLNDVNGQMRKFLDMAQSLHSSGIAQILEGGGGRGLLGGLITGGVTLAASKKAAEFGVQKSQQGDQITPETINLQHQLAMAEIETAHAGDARLGAEAKITAELQKQYDVNNENRKFAQQQDRLFGNQTVKDSGSQLQQQQDEAADQRAQAQKILLARQERDQVIGFQNDAFNSQLSGIELARALTQEAIDAEIQKYKDRAISEQTMDRETLALRIKGQAAVDAILDQQMQKLAEMQHQAETAGMTGIGKIQSDLAFQLNSPAGQYSESNPANQHDQTAESVAFRKDMRAAQEQQADAEILSARQQFEAQLNSITERSDSQTTAGYARIEAETQRSLDVAAKAWDIYAGKIDVAQAQIAAEMGNPAVLMKVVDAAQKAAQAENEAYANAARQRQLLEQKDAQTLANVQQQAARLMLPPWQAAEQQIRDQYTQTARAQKDSLDQQLAYTKLSADDQRAVWQQYNQQIAAASALAQAQMTRQLQQERDQISGALSQLFNDPANYMKQRAQQIMFDILANWTLQIMQKSPEMQKLLGTLFNVNGPTPLSGGPGGIFGGISGRTPVGIAGQNNPMSETLGLPGNIAGLGTAGTTLSTAGSTLSTAGTALTTSGTTLGAAGTTLSSSGTMLAASGSQLNAAATAVMAAAQALQAAASTAGTGGSGDGSGGGGGLLGGLSGLFGGSGSDGGSGTPGFDMEMGNDVSGSRGGISNFGLPSAGMSSAGMVGGGMTSAGMSSGVSGGLTPNTNIIPLGSGDITSGIGAPQLNGGQFQPTDIIVPPSGTPGVLGVPPGGSGGGIGLGGALGIAGAGVGGAMGLINAYQQHSPMGILSGAMSGAAAGAAIGSIVPGVGTLIGAAVGGIAGALTGLFGMLFGDGGRSKARHYDAETVQPALAKEWMAFNGGMTSYDQAATDLNNLSQQAQQQTSAMGSGARDWYRGHIQPEIADMQQKMQETESRFERGDREHKVTFSAAQFHSGGYVAGFGDMSTSSTEGFIHALQGEYVMHPEAARTNAPYLEAMNSGLDLSSAIGSALRRPAASMTAAAPAMYSGSTTGGHDVYPMLRRPVSGMDGPSSSKGQELHLHISALDAKSVDYWLRNGGARKIQSSLNAQVASYAGVSLG